VVSRVLVVQAREALAHATGRHLAAAGFEPTYASDGDDAVRDVVVDPPAVAILDLTLPVLDGWYVLAALGSRTPRPRLVVYCRAGDAARALALGADACVSDRSTVVDAVRRICAPGGNHETARTVGCGASRKGAS
jgi:DNA-binding response OmpR family regulator